MLPVPHVRNMLDAGTPRVLILTLYLLCCLSSLVAGPALGAVCEAVANISAECLCLAGQDVSSVVDCVETYAGVQACCRMSNAALRLP